MRGRDRLAEALGLMTDRLGSLHPLFGRNNHRLQSLDQGLGNGKAEPNSSDYLRGILMGAGLPGGLNARERQDAASGTCGDAEDLGVNVWVIGHGMYLCSYAPSTTTTNWPPIPPQAFP